MLESGNNHCASRGNVSRYPIALRATFTTLFLFLGLIMHGQNSIDRFFLKVEQNNTTHTLHYISEDGMYNSYPHQLTVNYKRHLSNNANGTRMKMVFHPIGAHQTNESDAYETGNEEIRFSVSMDLIRIDAPYWISSTMIKSVGGKMFCLESEVAGRAFTIDLSGFDAGFYTLEITRKASVRKPRH